MEVAIRTQMATVGYIERFWENLLKAGKEKLTRPYITARLQLLESYWARFVARHDEILSYDNVDATDYMRRDVYASTEERYIETKVRLNSGLSSKHAEVTGVRPPEDAGSVLRQIQLPKITLPNFDGDQLAWEGFRDLFKSLVHDAESLAPIQKLQYLKANLSGEAAAVVSNVEMSNRGYSLAWDELVARYDNQRVLLATHMRQLLAAPTITKPSASELNRLISTANQAIRSFRALGRPVDHWDDWFIHLLVEKLDAPTRLLWESTRTINQEFPLYEDLKGFLTTRARALDAAQPRAAQAIASGPKAKRAGRSEGVSLNATSAANDEKGNPCPLCRERHPLRSCPKFKTLSVEQRREKVRRLAKTCFNCLGQGHLAAACPSNNRCRYCGEKHHSLLHTEDSPADATTSALSSPSPSSSSDATETTPKVISLASRTTSTVLLATAAVRLISPAGRAMTVRALLDSASEASFLSERVAQGLRLPRQRVNVAVTGLQGVNTGRAAHSVAVMIGSRWAPSLRIALPRALVLPCLTTLTPGRRLLRQEWPL